MDKTTLSELPDFAAVRAVVEGVASLFSPQVIYLYNHKLNNRGEFTSFKLCVVGGFVDKIEAERALYWEIDSEIPFDVVLYTPLEWKELSDSPAAFASHIKETGMMVYG